MSAERGGAPLYMQVRESLALRITEGEWPAGGKLPGELELCRAYGVSRITVRQALKGLEDAGYIERKQGRGTTVRPRRYEQRLTGMYSFSEELTRLGAEPSSQILSFERKEAGEEAALRLGIGAGDPVYEIRRVRLAGQEPFAAEVSTVPQALAGDLRREAVEQKGLYAALTESAGILPERAEETFCAAALPAEFAPLLGEKKNAPAMLVERVALWQGVPVEYCVSWLRADRFRFRVELGPVKDAPHPPQKPSPPTPSPSGLGEGV